MSKIAIVIDSLSGGGAEKVMLDLASILQPQEQVVVISLQATIDHQIPANMEVHSVFDKMDKGYCRFWRINQSRKILAHKLQQLGPFKLILSNLDKSNLLLSEMALEKLVMVVHNSITEELSYEKIITPLAYFHRKKAKKALNQQHLITVSKGLKQEIDSIDWIKPKSISTIYNPYLKEHILPLADVQKADIPQGKYLLHIGRVSKQKDLNTLFAAYKLANTQLPLVMLCKNTKKALKLATKHGVEQHVRLVGFQQNPYPYIKNAELLVLSSRYEGLGGVLIEALMLNTKVVSTDCKYGPSEILSGELADYLSPVADAKALADNIDLALEQDYPISKAEILEQVETTQVRQNYLALCEKF